MILPNSLDADDLADGAVGTGEVAGGAVTTNKQKANAAASLVGAPPLAVVPASPA